MLFRSKDENLLYVGIARETPSGLAMEAEYFNENSLQKNQISRAQMTGATQALEAHFRKALLGQPAVCNASQVFRLPVMAVALPYRKKGEGVEASLLVVYLRLDTLLEAFQSRGITQTFMVNEEGNVIAHPDGRLVMANSNFLDLPIVRMMKGSKFDNGQVRYEDSGGDAYYGSFKRIGFGGLGVIATVREREAFAEVYRIVRRNLAIMGGFLLLAVVVVFVFSGTLSRPVIRLRDASREVEKGHYHLRLTPETGDEIGELTRSFAEMTGKLEERERLKEAFGKFVNEEIAGMVSRGEIKLGGDRKDVAVFFSHVRGFTEMSEELAPEEVVDFLNAYMTRMVDCVKRTGGVVDKFIGDAVMAIWGAPVSRGSDVEKAVNAALLMRESLAEFNRLRQGQGKPPVRIGCGINYGPVLAGQIGSEDRMEYTVIGDTVNYASRIEALNAPLGTDILVSERVQEHLGDLYHTEKMQEVRVKGKEETQRVYAVLGRRDDPGAVKSVEELKALLAVSEEVQA